LRQPPAEEDRDDPSPPERLLDRVPFSPASFSSPANLAATKWYQVSKRYQNGIIDTNPKPRREIPAGTAIKNLPAPMEAGRRTGWQTTPPCRPLAMRQAQPVGRSCLARHALPRPTVPSAKPPDCEDIRPTALRCARVRVTQGQIRVIDPVDPEPSADTEPNGGRKTSLLANTVGTE
jgi:hypothetical protein